MLSTCMVVSDVLPGVFKQRAAYRFQRGPVPAAPPWYSVGVQPYWARKQLEKWAGEAKPLRALGFQADSGF